MQQNCKKQSDGIASMKSALSNSIAYCITMIVGVVMLPITTRLLSPDDLGISVAFTSTRNICLILFTMAIYTAQNRGLLEFDKEKYKFMSSIFLFGVFSTICIYGATLPFKEVIKKIFELDEFLYGWLFFSVIFLLARTIGMTYLQFYNHYRMVAAFILMAGPLPQFLSVFLISMQDTNKYIGRIVGLDFFNVVAGLFFAIYLIKKVGFSYKKKYAKYSLKMSIPLIPHLLSQLLLSQSDVLMIKQMCSSSDAGIYSMAYTISMTLYSVLVQGMAAWSPWVYRQMEKEKIEDIYKYSKVIILLGALCSIGLIAISPELIAIVLSKSYFDTIYLIPSIVIGMFFQFLYLFFYDIEYYHKMTSGIAISSVVASVINIVLNFIFIGKYGYVAAGYTTAIGYGTLSLMHYYYMKKSEKRKVYDIRFVLVVSGIVSVLAMINLMLVHNWICRYSILFFVIIVVLYKMRTDLMRLVEIIRKK